MRSSFCPAEEPSSWRTRASFSTACQRAGGIDRLGRKRERPALAEFLVMFLKAVPGFLQFPVYLVMIVEHEDGVMKVIRGGDEPGPWREGKGRRTTGNDLLVRGTGPCLPGPSGPRARPSWREASRTRGTRASRGIPGETGRVPGPLSGATVALPVSNSRSETTASPPSLDPERIGLPGRENVDDASPPGVFARGGDQVLPGIAVFSQRPEDVVAVHGPPDLYAQERALEVGRRGHGLQEAQRIGHGEGRRPVERAPEELHPRRNGLEGRRDFKVRVVGERGQRAGGNGRPEPGEEEPAILYERGQGPRRRPDADESPGDLAGQAGENVGLGRVGDPLDPDAFLALFDGGQKVPEFGCREKKIQAHPNILDHRGLAVYPVGVPLR